MKKIGFVLGMLLFSSTLAVADPLFNTSPQAPKVVAQPFNDFTPGCKSLTDFKKYIDEWQFSPLFLGTDVKDKTKGVEIWLSPFMGALVLTLDVTKLVNPPPDMQVCFEQMAQIEHINGPVLDAIDRDYQQSLQQKQQK